jgi:hypothetical protein
MDHVQGHELDLFDREGRSENGVEAGKALGDYTIAGQYQRKY